MSPKADIFEPARTAAQPHRWQVAAGLVVGTACLAWLLHDIDISDLQQNATDLNWILIGLAVVVDTATYAIQGLRWKLLLRPVGHVSWLGAGQTVYAGLFASEVLPLRPGELVRAYVMSRKLHAPLSAIFPSMIVERLCDGLWIALGLSVAGMLAPLPPTVARTGRYFGVAMLVVTALVIYRVIRLPLNTDGVRPERPRMKLLRVIHESLLEIAEGLRTIGFSTSTWLALALSFVFL